MPASRLHFLCRLLCLAALVASVQLLAEHYPDPATRAENTYFLGLLLLVFGALVFHSQSTVPISVGTSACAVLLLLPSAQGTRAAILMAWLVTLVAWTALRGWIPRTDRLGGSSRLRWLDFVSIAIAWQALLQSGRLVTADWNDPRTAFTLIALPILMGVATFLLAQERGVVVALAGFVSMTLLLPTMGITPALLFGVTALWYSSKESAPKRRLSGILILGFCAWLGPATPAALTLLAACLLLRDLAGARWIPPVLAIALGVEACLPLEQANFQGLLTLLVLLPALVISERERLPLVLSALGLALSAQGASDLSLLAPAVAVGLVALRRDGLAVFAQLLWLGGLAVAASLSAAYPWLREPSLAQLEGSLALPGAILALGLLLGACLLHFVPWRGLSLRSRSIRWAPVGAVALVGLFLSTGHPTLLLRDAQTLNATNIDWYSEQPLEKVQRVTFDSFLSNATDLETGTPIAEIRVTKRRAGQLFEQIRVGQQTLGWAAAAPGTSAMKPDQPRRWISWIVGDSSLASRYRWSLELEEPQDIQRIYLRRASALPEAVQFSLVQVSAQ